MVLEMTGKNMNMYKSIHLCVLLVALIANNASAEPPPHLGDISSGDQGHLPSFPGAEGYGSVTRGGRGGKVIAVTNLHDSGPGSLRAAIEAAGPRIVVFRVSGTIDLKSRLRITNPYITIAGQTAPGDGIAIKRYPLRIEADEVILRYLRLRLGDETGEDVDALSARYKKNIMVDHISASWSVDETVSIYHCENVTVQWSLISESLYQSVHEKGTHGYGGIWGSNYSSYHHNILAHHSSRNPRFASGSGYTDFRNNLIYNWGHNSTYGGERQQPGKSQYSFSMINMVGNYYKPGPATKPGQVRHRIANPWTRDGSADLGQWYVADNFMFGNEKVSADNWAGGIHVKWRGEKPDESFEKDIRLETPWPSMPIHQHTALEAYDLLLSYAGASLPKRDAVDRRIVEEIRTGRARFGKTYGGGGKGIIDSQLDVGGWPELKSQPALKDSDGDGMPDDWERKHHLDPDIAADGRKDGDQDGYTNVEEYLNGTDPRVFVDYRRPTFNMSSIEGAEADR